MLFILKKFPTGMWQAGHFLRRSIACVLFMFTCCKSHADNFIYFSDCSMGFGGRGRGGRGTFKFVRQGTGQTVLRSQLLDLARACQTSACISIPSIVQNMKDAEGEDVDGAEVDEDVDDRTIQGHLIPFKVCISSSASISTFIGRTCVSAVPNGLRSNVIY